MDLLLRQELLPTLPALGRQVLHLRERLLLVALGAGDHLLCSLQLRILQLLLSPDLLHLLLEDLVLLLMGFLQSLHLSLLQLHLLLLPGHPLLLHTLLERLLLLLEAYQLHHVLLNQLLQLLNIDLAGLQILFRFLDSLAILILLLVPVEVADLVELDVVLAIVLIAVLDGDGAGLHGLKGVEDRGLERSDGDVAAVLLRAKRVDLDFEDLEGGVEGVEVLGQVPDIGIGIGDEGVGVVSGKGLRGVVEVIEELGSAYEARLLA